MTTAVRLAVSASAIALVIALPACAPDPGASASTPSTSVTAGAQPSTGPASTPSPTTTVAAIAVPPDCDSLYSSAMRASLDSQLAPLNDPGITLLSSSVSTALEVLASGAATLRCAWGTPGESGLSTNVTIVDAEQSTSLQDAFAAEGFGCSTAYGGIECRIQKQTIDLDDNLVTTGEVQYLRGSGWIATAYVGDIPDGYTQDIAGVLWG